MAALCSYARKLTRTPAAVSEADVAALRRAGLDDRAIVDANQVVAYFNYVNRVVEGLGVELEERWPAAVRTRRRYAGDLNAGLPTLDPAALPWLSVDQMREVDRLMVEEVGIALEQMMENAARHLVVAGAQVRVLLGAPPERLAPVPAHQHDILRRMGLDVQAGRPALGPADLVVDGLLGYSQAGPPRGDAAELLQATAGRRVLALDVPSGLELATGTLHTPHVVAEATMTLAAPKQALRAPGAAVAVGGLYLADISVPPLVWERLGLAHPSPFGTYPIARIGGNLDA